MKYNVHKDTTYRKYYNSIGEAKPNIFLAQKALGRASNYLVLTSLKLRSNEGMGCQKKK